MLAPQLASPHSNPQMSQANTLKLKIASWNVCGWSDGLGSNFREAVIRALDLDIICFVKLFLLGMMASMLRDSNG